MGLYKPIKNEIGVECSYHRILSITNRYNIIKVLVGSYSSKEVRDNELKKHQLRETLDELYRQANECLTNNEGEERFNKIQAQIREVQQISPEMEMVAFTTDIKLDLNPADENNISFQSCYEELKKTELFKGAVDL